MTVDTLPHGTARPSYPDDPLPSWVTELREHQVVAVREIVEAFTDGADVVFLDAPVGAGKTLIGELVRRELNVKQAAYICSDKALQDQFLHDFPYARVLKGRSNYATLSGARNVTALDCTFEGGEYGSCLWCDPVRSCPYREAKAAALSAKVAVLNTAYMLYATNYIGLFQGQVPLVIADEADMLEPSLIGFSEYEVPAHIGKLLGLVYPIKGAHKPTIVKWMREVVDSTRDYRVNNADRMDKKELDALRQFEQSTNIAVKYLQRDIDASRKHEDDDSDSADAGRWIREYDTRTLKMLPVTATPYGAKNLWRHGDRWLLMSGTIISSDEMADSLGLPLDYRTVTIPSPFPVENRPIILAPIANVVASAEDIELDRLAWAVDRIVERHEGRVLVHTVSYKLARELMTRTTCAGRTKVTYQDGRDKAGAMQRYLRTPGAVMFAASMGRGVDLAGDACECQVIAKCPFPYLGDKRISARLRLPGGQLWYSTKTVRDIVQMTGRGVRSDTDVCPTYILDQQFTRNVWSKSKHLFPAYFREAVNARADVRWMLMPEGRR